jgi:acyl dehydratase/NAD(P)-dependent dehydrogenase (short-subunit alcohol dehydrogenase family)
MPVSTSEERELTKLAERIFGQADQEQFAAVSGDRNPIHVDYMFARRTQGGAPVVHGISLLLWALDSFASTEPGLSPLRSLSAKFSRFVYLGEKVEVRLDRQGPDRLRLVLAVSKDVRSEVTLELGHAERQSASWIDDSLTPQAPVRSALDLGLEQMAECSGNLAFSMTAVQGAALFPSAAKWLGVRRIMALAASSYLVGMVCPGLRSLYSELSVETCSDPDATNFLAFRVIKAYPRLRLAKQEIAGGGIIGSLTTFVRNPPALQATMEDLAGIVDPNEFDGSVALIVGGSRGLGELTAKLIATGGGRVCLTWRSGSEDAERVAAEIRSAGGACATLAYDAQEPAERQLTKLSQAPTHAYYFATPAIFRHQADFFSGQRLNEFLEVYVEGFCDLVQALRARQPKLSVFYPSSIAVAERPRGMTEYSMAKAAGELLCADMNVVLAPMHVTTVRLPRLPTDQTASVTRSRAADPVETMLPVVREVQSWPR